MFFSIISPQNPPKLVIWNTKIPTREQNFPTNGLLGVGAPPPPPAPPLASALYSSVDIKAVMLRGYHSMMDICKFVLKLSAWNRLIRPEIMRGNVPRKPLQETFKTFINHDQLFCHFGRMKVSSFGSITII